jgi:hypothetical protein
MQRQELAWSAAYPVHSEAAVQNCTADLRRRHVRIGLLTLVAQGAEAGELARSARSVAEDDA